MPANSSPSTGAPQPSTVAAWVPSPGGGGGGGVVVVVGGTVVVVVVVVGGGVVVVVVVGGRHGPTPCLRSWPTR
ncbi:MAG TPA: hypothetical protein VHS35_24410 [Pseudonocardia sp.]|nr:hypothetical protein [Pseudonocardia sp.]